MGQAYRGAERFLKPGEKMVATIDGIGTITLPVVAGTAPPPAPARACRRSAPIASSSRAREAEPALCLARLARGDQDKKRIHTDAPMNAANTELARTEIRVRGSSRSTR